jgi:hypothetical protein
MDKKEILTFELLLASLDGKILEEFYANHQVPVPEKMKRKLEVDELTGKSG